MFHLHILLTCHPDGTSYSYAVDPSQGSNFTAFYNYLFISPDFLPFKRKFPIKLFGHVEVKTIIQVCVHIPYVFQYQNPILSKTTLKNILPPSKLLLSRIRGGKVLKAGRCFSVV